MTRKQDNLPAETSPPAAASARLAVHQMLPGEKIFATTAPAVELGKVSEIIDLLRLPKGLEEDKVNAIILRALDQFESIKPTDATESMLAAQMIGTHAAAMECLRRAMVPSQTFVGRDMELKHAHKLMTLYPQQLAALDKHRGKGQQTITVERVTVQSGGQAIVGNVGTDAAASPPEARRRKVAPPQLTYAPPPPNPLDGLRDAVPAAEARARKPRG